MANTIRVSGTRTTTPNSGGATISAPSGPILLSSVATIVTGNISVAGSANTVIVQANANNVENPYGFRYNPEDIYGTQAQRLSGAVYVAGGIGIEKDLNVGGYIYGRVSQANTSLQLLVTSTNIDSTFYPIFTSNSDGAAYIYSDKIGEERGLRYNPAAGKLTLDRLRVASRKSVV